MQLTSGSTVVTVVESEPIVKSRITRYVRKFVPDGTKLYVKKVGTEGYNISVRGYLTGSNFIDNKNQLLEWHNNDSTLAYVDGLESGSLNVKIVDPFKWELTPGWENLMSVELVLVEV
jgi:hypothetical protein